MMLASESCVFTRVLYFGNLSSRKRVTTCYSGVKVIPVTNKPHHSAPPIYPHHGGADAAAKAPPSFPLCPASRRWAGPFWCTGATTTTVSVVKILPPTPLDIGEALVELAPSQRRASTD